jgi:hypothetical protein
VSQVRKVMVLVVCCIGCFGAICAGYAQILLDGWLPIPDLLPHVPKDLLRIFGIIVMCIAFVLGVILYLHERRTTPIFS